MLPKVITHKNLDLVLLDMACDYSTRAGVEKNFRKWNVIVTLEFPLGEIAENGLKTACLVGMFQQFPRTIAPITGKENFAAQGLEGKMRVKQTLFGALINMRDNLAPHRGRIITH